MRLFLISFLLSCSGPSANVTTQKGSLNRIPVPPGGPVIVLAPLDVPKSWSGVETFKRAVQLVEALSEDGWPVMAPWEYHVYLTDAEGSLLKRSDAGRKWEALGARSSQIWVLDVSVREASSSQQTDVAASTARQHERYLNITLTLEDPRLREVLASVSSSIAQDPFNEAADEVDALPALSQALPELAHGLTDVMADQGAQVRSNPRSEATLQPSYITLETYAQEGQRALQDGMAGFDKVSRTALSLSHYQFFDSNIELETIERSMELPVGVKVLQPGNLRDLDIEAGDYLIQVGGIPFDGMHSVERLLLSKPPGGWRIVLERAGKRMILQPK